jgi:hypothetical protein
VRFGQSRHERRPVWEAGEHIVERGMAKLAALGLTKARSKFNRI